jgi:hypothetical protein
VVEVDPSGPVLRGVLLDISKTCEISSTTQLLGPQIRAKRLKENIPQIINSSSRLILIQEILLRRSRDTQQPTNAKKAPAQKISILGTVAVLGSIALKTSRVGA